MNLIWTEPALNDYDECITYLEQKITIFYTLHNEDTVQIIRIWNNRKDRRLFK